MRILIILAVVVSGLALPAHTWAQDSAMPCGDAAACPEAYPLRLAPAVLPGVPLVWSPTRGQLVPPPPGREPIELGRTIPLADIVGRRVAPLVRPTAPVMYNVPTADPSSGLTLMSLVPPRRPVLRRAD